MNDADRPRYSFSTKRLLGSGAFSEVYLGSRRDDDGPTIKVAVKRIAKEKFEKNPKMQRLLRTEVSVLRELRGHSNIVYLYDCFEDKLYMHLVLEYCETDLSQHLKKNAPLQEAIIHDLLSQLSRAVQHVRKHSVVHRDIKPHNVLLKRDETKLSQFTVKLTDFGFACKLASSDMTATFCGSPLHMAPEVLSGGQYDPKADLWSIGTIMYQCATGTTPYRANSVKELREKLMAAQRKRQALPMPQHVSREFSDLVTALLQPDPKKRLEFTEFYAHSFFHKQYKQSAEPSEQATVEPDPALPPLSQTIVDPNCTSYVLVDKRATDLAEKLETLHGLPKSQPLGDEVTQLQIREEVDKVSSRTAIVIRVAMDQTVWERLLLYGKALSMLRDASTRVEGMIGTMNMCRALPQTLGGISKLLNCMTYCLSQVDAFRKRVHDLENSSPEATSEMTAHNSATDVLYDAGLVCAKRAQAHEERGRRELAIALYQSTHKMLLIVQIFSTEEEAERVKESIETVNRRIHVLTTNSFSQIGVKTMEGESHIIGTSAISASRPAMSAPIDIPLAAKGADNLNAKSSVADSYGRARYCCSCGMKYSTAQENFCSLCGMQRTLISSSHLNQSCTEKAAI